MAARSARTARGSCSSTARSRATRRGAEAQFATGGGDGDTVIATDTLISFHHTLLVGNVADEAGGAFHIDDSMNVPGTYPKAHITTSTFEDNTALGAGGAVYAQGARIVGAGHRFYRERSARPQRQPIGHRDERPPKPRCPRRHARTRRGIELTAAHQLHRALARQTRAAAGSTPRRRDSARNRCPPPPRFTSRRRRARLEGVTVTGDARATFPLFAADQDANAELYSSAFDVTWHVGRWAVRTTCPE